MKTAEGLCNRYVRDRMMARESRDTEDFVQQAVRAVQAERTHIRIGDSTEGRDGLEPVSRRIGAGKREKAQRGSPRESPPGEEGGRPQWERPGRGNLPAGEVHELRRARSASREASSPTMASGSGRGGGTAEPEKVEEAPPPPAPSLGSEGEEEAITRYIFSIPAEEYRPSTSPYVRVKVFKKTIIAKMLIDSGNLVRDLISREFANLAGLQYEPERKKVGTAAKGGSVSIVGRLIQPLQLHIENISTPVFL